MRTKDVVLVAVVAWLAAGEALTQQSARVVTHAVGRIVDERGQPIAGAAVQPLRPGTLADVPAILAKPRTRTDDDGRYRVAVCEEDRNCWILFAAEGRQACSRWAPWTIPTDEHVFADIVLPPDHELTGRLRAPDGTPIVGAHVSIESALDGEHWFDAKLLSGSRSDERGRFRVPGVAREALDLRITHPGFLTHRQLVDCSTPLDLTLAAANTVAVRVVDAAGAPVADAVVTVRTVYGAEDGAHLFTDRDGRVRVAVPSDRPFSVSARSIDAYPIQRGSSTPRLPDDEEVVVAIAEPPEDTRVVHVVVRDATTGAVLPRIRVRPTMRVSPLASVVMQSEYERILEEDGECDVRVPVRTGGLRIDADGHGYTVVPCETGTDTVEAHLGAPCSVRGVVFDAVTGAPAAGVAVRAVPWQGNLWHSGRKCDGPPTTDEQGRFEIDGLPPGDYAVQVHVAGRQATAPVRATTTADRPGDVRVTIPAPDPHRVTVATAAEAERVATAQPVAWLHHELVGPIHASIDGPRFSHFDLPGRPKAVASAGSFTFAPRGSHNDHIFACVPSRHRAGAATTVEVFDDEARDAPIPFEALRGVAVRGRVVVEQALPFGRIALLATPQHEDPRRNGRVARTSRRSTTFAGVDATGAFVVDLLPGPYTLQLVDLETDIVFWVEPETFHTDTAEELELHPEIRWLELRFEPQTEGAPLIVPPIEVDVQDLSQSGRRGILYPAAPIRPAPGTTRMRWLVPAGTVSISIADTFTGLRDPQRRDGGSLFTRRITIDEQEHSVTIPLPTPPARDG